MAVGRVVTEDRDPGTYVRSVERQQDRLKRFAKVLRGAQPKPKPKGDPTEEDAAKALLLAEERLSGFGIKVELDDDTVVALKNGESRTYYVRVLGSRTKSLSIMAYIVSLKGVTASLVAVADDPDADKIEWIYRKPFEALAEDNKFRPAKLPLFDRAG